MTDRELLEMAAKAAGITAVREFTFECDGSSSGECKLGLWNRDDGGIWNPLTDDGDALRLAVKLCINIVPNYHAEWHTGTGDTFRTGREFTTGDEPNSYAATRRAIVRAAAEIGRMK